MNPALLLKFGQGVGALAAGIAAARVRDKNGAKHACGCGCCEIPETDCPPRCVAEITWKFARGAVPEASVLVRNVGKAARNFAFSASELAGVGVGTARLSVAPAAAMLQPGESTVVRVKLEDSLSLRACQQYRAEVLIKGSWEQCVKVVCAVQADPFDSVVVEQSDSLADKTFHPKTYKAGIDWKFERGVVPEAALTVHNTGKSAQTFGFEPSLLVGPDGAGAAVSVTPDSLQLSEGQTGVVRVKLKNSAALSPGQSYAATLLIRGFYEQRVEIRACVEPDAAGHAEVQQGEAPTRKRAHHWYDHFQCTDACAPRLG